MATQKARKSKNSKTVRRHRSSTSGKIQVPLDVRSNSDLPKFRKALKDKNLTIILVYATWCPHCHTLMPHFDAAAKSPNRSVSAVKINETMLDDVNNYIKKNVNSTAKPISVDGYPSIILVNKNAEKITDIEPVRNTESLKKVMENAGPLANSAGLNGNMLKNTNVENKEKASVAKNIDIGEDELKESIISTKNKINASSESATIENSNSKKNSVSQKMLIKNGTAPSPINMFSYSESEKKVNANTISQNAKKEAEDITSLQATIPSGTPSINIKPVSPPIPSNSEQSTSDLDNSKKMAGGSLMSALSRTTYTLAPAAVLLATAATVMKNKRSSNKKTSKVSKKYRKSMKRRN